jgi:hypothetical protein
MNRLSYPVLLLAAVLYLTACGGSPGPAGYLYSARSGVLYIQWRADSSGNGIQGTLTEDGIAGTAPSETVSVTSVPIRGTLNGSDVTIHFQNALSRLFGSGTLNGTINGSTLTFSVVTSNGSIQPSSLAQASTGAYNTAVTALHAKVRQDNTAAAQAQAAQAQQQQDDQDLQTAQSDLATLQGAGFESDLNNLTNDVKQANSDLAGEEKDASAGPNADGGDCYNLQQNVEYDAQQNVDYDLQQDVGYDLQQNLQPDISTTRQDIAALQADLQTLTSDGLEPPSGAASAVHKARAAIRTAKAAANADIDQANSDDTQAYSIADNLATGTCAGDGIGKPSALLAHI